MIRARKIIFIGLAASLLLLLIAYQWLLHSDSAAAWLWHKAQDLSSGAVQSSSLEGDLASGMKIRGFKYHSDTVEVNIRQMDLQAGPGWWPLSVQVGSLRLSDVDIISHSSTEPLEEVNQDIDIDAILTSLNLPIAIEVHDAVVTDISYRLDDGATVNLAESLSFQAALDEQLRIIQLRINAAGIEANLRGWLGLEAPFELNASVDGQWSLDGHVGQPGPFELKTSGNLEKLQFSLAGLNNGLQLDGDLSHPASNLSWDIKAGLDQLQWPLDDSDDVLKISGLTLVSQGQIDDWSVGLESSVAYDVLQSSLLTLSGSGSATSLQVDNASLRGPAVDLQVNGQVDWSAQPQAGLKAVIKQLDLSPWLDQWPEGHHLLGELEANWSESGLEIPPGQLRVSGTDIAVNIEADIDLDANTIDSRLDWTGLSWPLTGPAPDFASPEGELHFTGNLDQWQALGRVTVQTADYPQGVLNIEGAGKRSSAAVTILAGEVLGGSIKGKANVDWTNALIWNANINAAGIDPEPLLPDWPGNLDIEARISAQSQAESIQIEVESLQGVLRSLPLNANGGLDITAGDVSFNDIVVRTGEAVLQLDGSAGEAAGVKVKFNGNLPSVLLDGASGSLELEGSYSSNPSKPVFQLQMQALELAWNDLSIKSMAVSTRETGVPGILPIVQLDAAQLSWADNNFDELSMSLSPAGDKQQLTASLVNQEVALHTAMTIEPVQTGDLFAGPWSGMLDELAVNISPAYNFELTEPTPVAWSVDTAKLGPACIHEDSGAELCLTSQLQANDDWLLSVDADSIPINYIRDIFNLDLQFEQMIEGHLELHQIRGQAPTGGAEFRITAGRVLDLDDNESLLESNEGKLAFLLQDGNLESGTLDIEFPGSGFIDLDFDVLNLIENGARKLNGRAVTQLSDINIVGQLMFPAVDQLSGSFESDIQLGGTLSDPSFEGGFKFSKGLVRYSPVGLNLEDIDISGILGKHDNGSLQGSFRAGEGIGTLSGTLLFSDLDNMQVTIDLSGEHLLLVNTDPLKIHAETDLKFELSPQRMDINGHIKVPVAQLTPANLLLETVSDSEDLVIETGERKPKAGSESGKPALKVYGELEVAFGDDVVIKVPGVKTNFSGSVLYRWSGDPVPLADGFYTLNGSVDIYGPTLSIQNGQISFPKVPANNPQLNIRAGREILGNTQIRSAGVQLTGTLKRPVLKAYTIPITNEDRAWALLVTGSDFDQSQGVKGFDVGTYIAPKLYVSYGISLFEDENVVSARYDLKKGFGIKVTSGQRETGLDVSYTIDR